MTETELLQLKDEFDLTKSNQLMLQNMPQEIVYGFLKKKGLGESLLGRRNWKKRWFVLEGPHILYYENPYVYQNGLVPLGGVVLMPDTIVECTHQDEDSKKPHFYFRVVTQQRTLEMCARSEEERQAWINQINLHKTMSRKPLPFL
eukprot:CAMPEP_0168567916 /NCGR_PEP_ID=MMETSP0413-20121227/15280_1 /TAXON_ID=136452 /ORGANISM="Filamoeba nolandi, Strain NC-AS-23-1" /LENGTH=145 /DNA_ID=CAMNT_0008600179 /DNA_START=66 /DNA_END=503 /DNA_ORIENTATION=+